MQIAQAKFRRINTFTAWGVFLAAFIVYFLTVEPTASFWDCGEYIACAWGLEVGHPPGAPLFLLLGRLAGLLSFGNNENVALMINLLSATASAFTVFFLHLSITALAKKALLKLSGEENFKTQQLLLIQLAGIVGALSFAFTDTFWFSAVEGEVYALSSLFTAIVVWAMLRWEAAADEPQADRWLIFIAYMMGLSVGVHLLNLLCIPALVFIWYYRKYKTPTRLGLLITSIVSVVLLGGIQNVIIPGVVNLCGKTELFFVNELGMPFNSGTIAYFALLTLLLAGGIVFTQLRKMAALNTILLAFTTLLIGYSSFFILIIRAQASPPINENNTSNAVSLLSYLNREQYGDWPLLYGRTYAT
ncbi:MAG: glycosyltransferase family 117 protein, partial [Bacteroidia bacterium]